MNIPFVITHYSKLTDRKAYLDKAFEAIHTVPHWITDGDAQTMPQAEIDKFYVYDEKIYRSKCWQEPIPRRLSAAATSCSIKHVLALRFILAQGWPVAAILEDDVLLSAGFETRFPQFVDSLPADWDIAVFGTGNRGYCLDLDKKPVAVPAEPSCPLSCTDSILYTAKAASKIVASSSPFHLPWDWELDWQIKHNHLKTYAANPGLVCQGSCNGVYQSGIQGNTYL